MSRFVSNGKREALSWSTPLIAAIAMRPTVRRAVLRMADIDAEAQH
jgi:hypothetical protein